jgi:predicted permease
MRALKTIRLRLRSLFRGDRVEQDLSDELRDHLERQVEVHLARGVSAADAHAMARREFGNVPLIQERARDTWGVRWFEALVGDVRYALRSMRRARLYTAVALLSLSLGIGANAAIFSLIDHVMMKSLPVEEPARLFFIDNSGGKSGGVSAPPYPAVELMRERNRFLSGIAAFTADQFKVTIDGVAEDIRGQYASGNYFDLLGVRAVHGRMLTPVDDSVFERGGPEGAVAVISHALWRRRFGMDPGVVGRRVTVATTPVTIVGVMPPGFTGLQPGLPIDITVPMMVAGSRVRARTLWWFSAVGRLKPDATVEQARADLHALWDGYMTDVGQPPGKRNAYFTGVELVPAARGLYGLRRDFGQPLGILMAIVTSVLLIGCANVANLLVARGSARRNEIAVRLSLGASRARVVRQLITEGAVLVALGSMAGLAFGRWGVAFLTGMLVPAGQGRVLEPAFDWRVLAFTALVAAVTTLLFSLAPALHSTRIDAAKPTATGLTGAPAPRRLRQTLVVVQLALSMALLAAAALFLQTLTNLRDVDMGFRSTGVLTMQVEATLPRVTEEPRTPERRLAHARVGAIWEGALARVRQLPGVTSAGVGGMSPLTGRDRGVLIQVLSGPRLADEDRSIHVNQVSAGFLETMGIEVVSGRTFTSGDRGTAARVAILNASAARVYFPDGKPLGGRIGFPGQTVEEPYEVVGVVRDARYETVRKPDERMAYLPVEQSLEPLTNVVLAVRGSGGAAQLLAPVRKTMAAAVPGGFVSRIATMDERLEAALVRERLLTLLAAFFAGLALILSGIGLYGVMAYGIIRRTREIATHIAIGATHASVAWMVVREVVVLVSFGAALGAAAALAGGRFVRSQLFDVAPGNPAALGAATLLLIAAATAAAYFPARRAMRIDPAVALRME